MFYITTSKLDAYSSVAALMECDAPEGAVAATFEVMSDESSCVGSRRRRRAHNKGKGESQQAGPGCEASAASDALVLPAAGPVRPTDGASTQAGTGQASPAELAGHGACTPSSASAPPASAPAPAAATRCTYKTNNLGNTRDVPADASMLARTCDKAGSRCGAPMGAAAGINLSRGS